MGRRVLGGFLVCVATACGGDDGNSASLDDSALVSSLNDAQRNLLCDWAAQQEGGYGKEITCPLQSVIIPKDQQACRAQIDSTLRACKSGTVGQLKACVEGRATDPCRASTGELYPAECKAYDQACAQ